MLETIDLQQVYRGAVTGLDRRGTFRHIGYCFPV